jgi:hypothetical protein
MSKNNKPPTAEPEWKILIAVIGLVSLVLTAIQTGLMIG